MIKGKVKGTYLTVDDILIATGGGFHIFKYYLGNVSKLMQRPWGKKEKKLSWGIFPINGVWFYKDHADESTGTAIHFVEKYFSLNFNQAKDKICFDFGLGGKEININPVKITWEKPNVEKDYTDIVFNIQPFKKKHHEFWNIVEVDEVHCKKYNCYALKDVAINRKKVNVGINEVAFVYTTEGGCKLYFSERDKEGKFRGNLDFHYLWNYENVEECENLIIQKSNKDMIVTTLITPCVIATQSEAVKIFDKNVVDKVNKISKKPWIWYGSDWDGVKKCKEVTDTNSWRYINTEKKYLPDVNDVYSIVRMWNLKSPGSGLKNLEKFMKSKNLIE